MNNEIRKLLRIWKLDRMKKGVFFTLMLISVFLSIAVPMVFVDFVDVVTKAASISSLIKLITIYFILNITQMFVEFAFDYYSSVKEFEFAQHLKLTALDRLFKKDGKFFANEKTGDLMTVVNDDAAKLASFIYKAYKVIVSLVQAIGIMGVMFYYDVKLTLLLIVMIPITLAAQQKFGNKLRYLALENRRDYGEQNALTEEFISNAPAMITYGFRRSFLNKYELAADVLKRSFKKLTLTNGFSNQAIDMISTISLIAITAFGGYQVFQKQISMGVMVIFLQYCTRFIAPFENLVFMKVSLNMVVPSLNNVDEVLGGEMGADDSEGKQIVEIDNIKIENLTFGYTRGKNILNGLDLDFEKNKKYLICGKSGAGKTTIFNLILGLWRASSGNIYINDDEIGDIDLESFRDRISLVSQKTFFLHDTIYNNLTNGRDIPEEKVWEALRCVELDDFVRGMENGLHTMLGDDGMTMSGGQRQRLAIARSMLKRSDVVIFDEPTSALDKNTEKIIARSIMGIKDKIIIIVSHSNCFSDQVDQIYKIG
ncbi:ABC transporter ATP-binding protein [Ruminococcus albus]|uniref:ABC-type multidrug transport system, ATPase and permease component n=1 Tax=Ruminococcus albus TaxID=1264 RepID=A0A1H7I7K0_RUMAL|nr:ABC transporter ATP-binding protein [Ruminococcus albus]SEK57480.1 ABC-type multidrug transport system, ATPase and permease component [Ruminococcus albus]